MGSKRLPQFAYRFLIRCAPAEHSIVLLRNQRTFHAPTEAIAWAPTTYAYTAFHYLLAQLSKTPLNQIGPCGRKENLGVQSSRSQENGSNQWRSQEARQENPFGQHRVNFQDGVHKTNIVSCRPVPQYCEASERHDKLVTTDLGPAPPASHAGDYLV